MALNQLWSHTAQARTRLQTLLTQCLAAFGLFMLVLLLGGKLPAGAGIETAQASIDPSAEVLESKIRMDSRQQRLVRHLARRYRVATEVVEKLVSGAYMVGREMGVDPMLILAVVSIESSFNPIAESSYGAKGLMQVVPRFHQDKLADHGGAETIFDMRINMAVGTQILKDYIRHTGSLENGLQMYGGAMDDDTFTYSQKVLGERDRLHQVLGGAALTNV
jgi:soluble lytic murein transglycosylase-like protein